MGLSNGRFVMSWFNNQNFYFTLAIKCYSDSNCDNNAKHVFCNSGNGYCEGCTFDEDCRDRYGFKPICASDGECVKGSDSGFPDRPLPWEDEIEFL